MTASKQELAVAALRNGTVIDHIPARVLFKVAHILGVEKTGHPLTIGNNLPSARMGRKGIIKIADVEFEEKTLNRIALIAPGARVNIIRNYEVAEKRRVTLPERLVGLVRCPNAKCITNNEPMRSAFDVVDRDAGTIRCRYCGHEVSGDHAELL